MSAIELAESLLKSGNVKGAQTILNDSAPEGEAKDLLLARCALRLRDHPAAIAAYASVLARNPRNLEAAMSLGAIYTGLRWLDKADAHYSRALKRLDDASLHAEYGALLWVRGNTSAALKELSRAVELEPDHYEARYRRATLMVQLGRREEALADFLHLTRRWPDRGDPWNSMGVAEVERENLDEAVRCFREAVRCDPNDPAFVRSFAIAISRVGEIEEAKAAFDRLQQLDPASWQKQHASTRDSRLPGSEGVIDPRPVFLLSAFSEQQRCFWKRRPLFEAVMHDTIANPGVVRRLRFSHGAGIVPMSLEERLQLARGAALEATIGAEPYRHEPSPTPTRLRIGYLMARVGDHVVAKIMASVIEAHDPATTDIHVIAVSGQQVDRGRGMRQRYASMPGVTLHDLADLDDAAVAARLHALGLDVLVDLAVYNDNARPGIPARRPAPVQVNYLGGPYSSGADWLDYILVDDEVRPTQPGWCSEAEVKMSGSYFVFSHDDAEPPEPPTRTTMGLPEDRFLYSALNNAYKIDPRDFDSWARILSATPGSLLLLRDGEGGMAANLRAEAEKRSLDPARLLFLPYVSPRDHLLRQGLPDLFLDTYLYGAHTTMAESLWMGVPGVTCRGDSFQSRVGASLLASCGLRELVAKDMDDFEAIAIGLFHDRDRLRGIKQGLRQSVMEAVPFNTTGQARQLEKAFRHMRDRFAAGLAPAPFAVADL